MYFSIIVLLATLAGVHLNFSDRLLLVIAGVFLSLATKSDLATLCIPNKLNLAFGLAMVLGTLASVIFFPSNIGHIQWWNFARSVLAGVSAMATFLVAHLINSKGLGMGDVKLAFGLGVFLGWFSIGTLFLGFIAAFIMNGISALVQICFSKRGRRHSVLPFAPALASGSFLGVLFFNM